LAGAQNRELNSFHFLTIKDRQWVLVHCEVRMLNMKQILATCIAIAVLWVVDAQFNEGRYSAVVKQAFRSMIAR